MKRTVRETYDYIWDMHYKYLYQNHMADDRSRRLATLYAVKYTWRVYNDQ